MKRIFNCIIVCLLLISSFTVLVYAEDFYDVLWKYGDDKKLYWYENNIKQGTYDDPACVMGDGTCRGREIYDPSSDGWYWLDSVYNGAKAESKEVWMPYIYQDEVPGSTGGKWVRYDENGKMIKGWYKTGSKYYYYDKITGAMLKGKQKINNKYYYFDEITGVLNVSKSGGNQAPANIQNNNSNNMIFKNHQKEFEKAYIRYINAYDYAFEGTSQMQAYSDIRAPQLATDFSHNFDKTDAAAIQAGLSEDGLWYPYSEAIQYYMNSNLDNTNYEEIAKNMAAAMRNSQSHWSYVGPATSRSYGFYYTGNYIYIIITTCS